MPSLADQVARWLRLADGLDCAGQVRLAAELHDQAGATMLAAASILTDAHKRSSPREFDAALDQVPITRATVDRLVRIHERYHHLPSAAALVHVGLGKLEALASLDDSEMETLAQGGAVRGIDLERVEMASRRQLELDLSMDQATSGLEAMDWKRRYERQARENRELRDRDPGKDFERRCIRALTGIQSGVDELLKLAELARRDAAGAGELNGSVELLADTVKNAGRMLQHRFGKAKNQLAQLGKAGAVQ